MQHYKHDAHTALILLTVFVLLCICEEKRCRLQHVLGRDERAPPRAVAEKSDNVKFVMDSDRDPLRKNSFRQRRR
jgi:hypothetical protein